VQNQRVVGSSCSSPACAKDASASPVTTSDCAGTSTTKLNAVPLWRWQLRQWQTAAPTGSASEV
jgi:hypothetical protein